MKRLRRYVAALVSAFSIAMVVPAGLAAGPLLIDDFGKGLSRRLGEEDLQGGDRLCAGHRRRPSRAEGGEPGDRLGPDLPNLP